MIDNIIYVTLGVLFCLAAYQCCRVLVAVLLPFLRRPSPMQTGLMSYACEETDRRLDNADVDIIANDPNGRVLGQRIGRELRLALGYPQYTRANEIVASQRIDAQLKELKSLRFTQRAAVHQHAMRWTFQPSFGELEMRRDLTSDLFEYKVKERYSPVWVSATPDWVRTLCNMLDRPVPVWTGLIWGWKQKMELE